MNKRGVQGLWITTPQTIAQDVNQAPRVAFKNASIFDLDWHPSEQKLLFTADESPAMNIYELNVSTGDIVQKQIHFLMLLKLLILLMHLQLLMLCSKIRNKK